MKKLELVDINKSYETNVPVLKNVSFSVENGEFLVLLGPSGCGKSTILSIIAGFEKQNDGSVIIDGRNCDTVSCQNRDIAMVFQNYALYPNTNIFSSSYRGWKYIAKCLGNKNFYCFNMCMGLDWFLCFSLKFSYSGNR